MQLFPHPNDATRAARMILKADFMTPSEQLFKELNWLPFPKPAPIAQLVECPLRGTGGHGFDAGPRHTKSLKMVLAAPRLALRFTG